VASPRRSAAPGDEAGGAASAASSRGILVPRSAQQGAGAGHRLDERDLWQIILERAQAGGEGASTPAQISICAHCERGWRDGAGFRAELAPAELACAQCDAEHLGAVDCEQPGRKQPTLSDKKRKRIIARDHHRCAVPGCRSARNIDVHHIVHQEDGGGHQDWDLVATCAGHHRMHHRGWLAIEGRAPDAIRFEWKHRAHVGAGVRRIEELIAEALRRCPRPLG